MKTIKIMLLFSTLLLMGGCAVVPVAPGYYSGPSAYYDSPSAYYYYGPPVYVVPSVEFGIYRGWGGHRDRGRR